MTKTDGESGAREPAGQREPAGADAALEADRELLEMLCTVVRWHRLRHPRRAEELDGRWELRLE